MPTFLPNQCVVTMLTFYHFVSVFETDEWKQRMSAFLGSVPINVQWQSKEVLMLQASQHIKLSQQLMAKFTMKCKNTHIPHEAKQKQNDFGFNLMKSISWHLMWHRNSLDTFKTFKFLYSCSLPGDVGTQVIIDSSAVVPTQVCSSTQLCIT